MTGNEDLQELSKKYFRGEISKPEYRLHRQKIIDELTGAAEDNSSQRVDTPQSPTHTRHPPDTNIALKAGVITAAVVVTLILMYVTR